MKNNKQHFTASLESFDQGFDVMADHTDQLSYEYEAAEMADGRELTNQADCIEGAETDIASLESLLEAIEDARDVGMEAWSAQFAHVQVSSIQKRYDLDGPLNTLPALECFNGHQARLATSVSMETVRETIINIAKWIKEKILQFIDMISKYWQRLTRSLDHVSNEAAKMKKKAATDSWTGGKVFNLPPTIAERLSVNGKVPQSSHELIASLTKFQNLNKIPHETMVKVHQRICAQQESHFSKHTSRPYTAEVMIPQGWTEILHGSEKTSKDTDRYSSGEAKTFCSPTLPGNLEIRITVYGEANQAKARDNEENTNITAKPFVEKLPGKEPETEVRALSSSEVVDVCSKIQELAGGLKYSRQELDRHISNVKRDISNITNKHVEIKGDKIEQLLVSAAIRSTMKAMYTNSVVYGTKLSQTCEKVAYEGMTACLSYAKHSAIASAEQESVMLALPAPAA